MVKRKQPTKSIVEKERTQVKAANKKGKVKKKNKPKKKQKLHPNSFEQRQINRQNRLAAALKKRSDKEKRIALMGITSGILHGVKAWAKNNPLNPSIVPAPVQEGIDTDAPSRKSTYKALLRNLPRDVTPKEIDDHFTRRGIYPKSVRIMVHLEKEFCRGYGFVEFDDQLEYEKGLTLNVSRFRDDFLLVQANFYNFNPSRKKPQKMLAYHPKRKPNASKKVEPEPMAVDENPNETRPLDEEIEAPKEDSDENPNAAGEASTEIITLEMEEDSNEDTGETPLDEIEAPKEDPDADGATKEIISLEMEEDSSEATDEKPNEGIPITLESSITEVIELD